MAKPYVIGIDMGGTNTAFGLVDARGNVIASSSIKTAKHSDINDYIDELYEAITAFSKRTTQWAKCKVSVSARLTAATTPA